MNYEWWWYSISYLYSQILHCIATAELKTLEMQKAAGEIWSCLTANEKTALVVWYCQYLLTEVFPSLATWGLCRRYLGTLYAKLYHSPTASPETHPSYRIETMKGNVSKCSGNYCGMAECFVIHAASFSSGVLLIKWKPVVIINCRNLFSLWNNKVICLQKCVCTCT